MNYEEFKEQFTEDVKERLYEQGIEASIETHEVNKLMLETLSLIKSVDLSNVLDTTPNYLLGVNEEKIQNSYVQEIIDLLGNITDPKVKDILLVQIKALADK